METGYRYRLLLYFAALVLCLSACFAYAESPTSLPVPSHPAAVSVSSDRNAAPGPSPRLAGD